MPLVSRPLPVALLGMGLAATVLAGCPKSGSPATVTAPAEMWLDLGPDVPALCVSSVPAAERAPAAARKQIDVARDTLRGGTAPDISALPEHPSADAIRGAARMLGQDMEGARVEFRDLANAYPDDPCLGQAAAYTAMVTGQISYAEPYLKTAMKGDASHPDVGVPAAVLVVQLRGDTNEALRILRKVHEAHPDHLRTRAWLGRLHAQRGEYDVALPHLKAAKKAGLRVTSELAVAAYTTGDTEAYLSVAGRSPPLSQDLTALDAPMAAYREMVGLEENTRLIAILETSMGDLHCELFWEQAPVTVAAFVGFANGTGPWTDPRTEQPGVGPLYRNIVFHRVIPEFMIQTGDPLGRGSGGPGFRFQDEIDLGLGFDRPGRLGMANSGPNTNGSQFFITETPAPHLTGKHTVFGQCDPGAIAVAKAIARVPRDQGDKPIEPVRLQQIRIENRPLTAVESPSPTPVPAPN